MQRASKNQLDQIRGFDSPTIFNAIVDVSNTSGGGQPVCYTEQTLKNLTPDLGCVVGYAVTSEVTTNDEDSAAIPWDDYYKALDQTDDPIMAVMRDVDTRPGRGANFGDNMAAAHVGLGVVGALVEGTVRDLPGIQAAGLAIWAHGTVPGHGVFNLTSVNRPVVIAGLIIHPGDLLIADLNGCTKIAGDISLDKLIETSYGIRDREKRFQEMCLQPGFNYEKWKTAREI
ncbi:MAG: Regulator of RNase E activity RraA [Chloroflexi bacterium]|nr:MAG: Regulator of RNase E activity RraA [Chloroflexota bacterium]